MKMILVKIRDLIQKIKYKLSGKHKYFLEVEARIEVVRTQKKADLIEVELQRKIANGGLLKYEEAYLQIAKTLLETKRRSL